MAEPALVNRAAELDQLGDLDRALDELRGHRRFDRQAAFAIAKSHPDRPGHTVAADLLEASLLRARDRRPARWYERPGLLFAVWAGFNLVLAVLAWWQGDGLLVALRLAIVSGLVGVAAVTSRRRRALPGAGAGAGAREVVRASTGSRVDEIAAAVLADSTVADPAASDEARTEAAVATARRAACGIAAPVMVAAGLVRAERAAAYELTIGGRGLRRVLAVAGRRALADLPDDGVR